MALQKTIQLTLPPTAKKSSRFIMVDYIEWDRLHRLIGELKHALKVIAEGEKEWRAGKTRSLKSLRELV